MFQLIKKRIVWWIFGGWLINREGKVFKSIGQSDIVCFCILLNLLCTELVNRLIANLSDIINWNCYHWFILNEYSIIMFCIELIILVNSILLMAALHYASWRAWCPAARILPHSSWSTTLYTMLHTPYYYTDLSSYQQLLPSKWLISNLF